MLYNWMEGLLVDIKYTNKTQTNYSPTGERLAVQDALVSTKFFTLRCDDLMIGTDHKLLLGLLENKILTEIYNS